jgi:casein kinase II subunit beta
MRSGALRGGNTTTGGIPDSATAGRQQQLLATSHHQHGGGGGGNRGGGGDQDDEDTYSYDEEEDDEEDEIPWVVWFCGLKGNEFFCEVDEEYIRDDFNLTGLSLMVPFFDHAVEMILDLDSPQDERLTEEQQRLVDSSAETLYGLIHARFILTPRGLKLMEEKYKTAAFGRCPRISCQGHPVLPVGQSDIVRESSVKLYCPKCRELYFPRSARHKALDGAFWGTTFPHLLLLTLYDGPPPIDSSAPPYVPRVFGFRIRDPRKIEEEKQRQQDAFNPLRIQQQQQQIPMMQGGGDPNLNNQPRFNDPMANVGGGQQQQQQLAAAVGGGRNSPLNNNNNNTPGNVRAGVNNNNNASSPFIRR